MEPSAQPEAEPQESRSARRRQQNAKGCGFLNSNTHTHAHTHTHTLQSQHTIAVSMSDTDLKHFSVFVDQWKVASFGGEPKSWNAETLKNLLHWSISTAPGKSPKRN